jgi:hypothetical protein
MPALKFSVVGAASRRPLGSRCSFLVVAMASCPERSRRVMPASWVWWHRHSCLCSWVFYFLFLSSRRPGLSRKPGLSRAQSRGPVWPVLVLSRGFCATGHAAKGPWLALVSTPFDGIIPFTAFSFVRLPVLLAPQPPSPPPIAPPPPSPIFHVSIPSMSCIQFLRLFAG